MTKRIERIYNYLHQQFSLVNTKEREYHPGFTTNEVALALDLQRSNVSKDLNRLTREGRVKKIEGRPVRYLPLIDSISATPPKYVPSYKEERVARPIAQPQFIHTTVQESDIFSKIVGAKSSMKNAVEQAKAAVLYPPKGLNCLITGPTGSGKTYFAHAMFQFAKSKQVIEEQKELIVFNCADYANNPELLMSHLFGYVQGAFTGADKDKVGIIDQANGGMLFLDEIHRLSPEGQEMIFYFMDHGVYSRLGESRKNRQADVRIVCATTEDPNSSLLDTFVRRIPINIHLPSFEQRPATEKLELVKRIVAQEANRIQRKISLTEDVIKALIGSVSYGNIGQLKSNIQLACARGFLNHMQSDEIAITMDGLPEGIRSGMMMLASQREALAELAHLLQPKIVIDPNQDLLEIQTDTYELPYNLYDIIGDKAELLKADGLDQESINHFISTDINIHLKSFYKNHGFSFHTGNKLSEFVDQKVIDITNQIYERVHQVLPYESQQNFIYAMSLHISSFLKKIHHGEEREINDNIRQMVIEYPLEFELAQEIRKMIASTFQVPISESEDYYLAVLLISLRANQKNGKIGVVVAAHGNSTASSMVDVVKQLLKMDQVAAVDMPLDMSPKTALEKIKTAVRKVDKGSGVILLVDMGSLATFDEVIHRETGVEVRTIDMVTTSVVLEAVRKASGLEGNLETLYESLRHFRGYSSQVEKKKTQIHLEPAILAICATGEGTAMRIKEMIQRSLSRKQDTHIEVVTLSVLDIQQKLPEIQQKYHLVAATGIIDPKIEAPFISLDSFIHQNVDELLEQILQGELLEDHQTYVSLDEKEAMVVAKSFIEENLTYINANKLLPTIWTFVSETIQEAGFESPDYGLMINLALHTAGMIERMIVGQPLQIEEKDAQALVQHPFYPRLHLRVQSLERFLLLQIPISEEYFLMEIIDMKKKKEGLHSRDIE